MGTFSFGFEAPFDKIFLRFVVFVHQGVLLILVRRPFDIGDRVVFVDANAAVNNFGPPSGGWIVESVDLYATTCRLGTARECATFTNGSLANSRILNLKRSEKPNVYMYLKVSNSIKTFSI